MRYFSHTHQNTVTRSCRIATGFGLHLVSPRASDKVVAQVSNLLYRRLPACGCAEESGVTVMATLCRLEIGDTAGWKPALRGTGRTLSVALLLNLLNPNCNFPKCKEGLD